MYYARVVPPAPCGIFVSALRCEHHDSPHLRQVNLLQAQDLLTGVLKEAAELGIWNKIQK